MSKAEDRAAKKALERFPVHEGASKEWIESHIKGICSDYIEGYHQAEKDNELTWEDVNTIIGLYNNLDDKTLCSPKRACKDILKQFKERKEK